jgi:prepilin-type N-terminal cleavage/methylation domain-containing protein
MRGNLNKKPRQSGFTLIELVVVLIIVGILAVIAVPRFIDLTGSATSTADQATISSIQSGYAVALAANNGNPPSLTDLANAVSNCSGAGTDTVGPFELNCNGRIFTYTVTTGTAVFTGLAP